MFFQPLRPDALRLQRQAAAVRAGQRRGLACATVMALQAAAAGVHGHRRIAALARGGPTAVMAEQHGCIAAAVLEHQHLVPGLQMLGDAGQYLRRQPIAQRPFAYVEHAHHGGPRRARALLQAQVGVAAGLRVVQ